MIIDIEDKAMTSEKEYNSENIVDYELKTRDSRIGEITNASTSILNKLPHNDKQKKQYEDDVSLLRILQGKEIDFLKSGLRWQMSSRLRNFLKQLPFFLLHNYPKKLGAYYRISKENRALKKGQHVKIKERKKLNGYKSPSPLAALS